MHIKHENTHVWGQVIHPLYNNGIKLYGVMPHPHTTPIPSMVDAEDINSGLKKRGEERSPSWPPGRAGHGGLRGPEGGREAAEELRESVDEAGGKDPEYRMGAGARDGPNDGDKAAVWDQVWVM